MKYSLFIGRWQPWHDGHRWLIDQRLKEGKNVLICIRDVEPDENQPWTPQEILMNLSKELEDFDPMTKAIAFGDKLVKIRSIVNHPVSMGDIAKLNECKEENNSDNKQRKISKNADLMENALTR